MCAITGFLDYGHKVHHRVLLHLVKALTVAAECRGTDATGMSYVKDGEKTWLSDGRFDLGITNKLF